MNTTGEKPIVGAAAEKKTGKKASTNELPMVDLGVVLEFVEKIEIEGLQTLTAQEVAKRTGYTTSTSTPFYRRLVGAKLFGLLDTAQGVNLTKLALDHFKPTDDESKSAALLTAVKNVVGYQKILERYTGKRLPQVDILTHLIEREFSLTSEAAKICASVFASSAQRAQLLQADGTLTTAPSEHSRPQTVLEAATVKTAAPSVSIGHFVPTTDNSESHYLTLDSKRGRRVMLQAPPVITASELKRIQNWLAVQLDVVESLENESARSATDENGSKGDGDS